MGRARTVVPTLLGERFEQTVDADMWFDIGTLAHELQLSRSTVANWATRGVPGRDVHAVARKLGVNPEWLQDEDCTRERVNE